jgi:signal transduction histidine kinase
MTDWTDRRSRSLLHRVSKRARPSVVLVAMALSSLFVALTARAAETTTPDGVLIIHSNQRAQPATVIIGNVLGSAVTDALLRPVYFFEEYLDIEWVSTEEFAAVQAEFLRQKYSGRNVRVIVADTFASLRFTLKFRDRMLPGVPVVHVSVPIDQLEGVSLPADVVGKPIDLNPAETLMLALRLQPGAERIVFVIGAAPRDRIWAQRLRKAVAQMEKHPEVEYLEGLPTAVILERLSALSRNTIVFTPGYFLDGAGQVGTPARSAELIGSVSAAPVYGPFDTFIGAGIVGGYMAPFDDQASQAGALVVRLLNGTSPTSIAQSAFVNVPVVDWRALHRWGIDEQLLPADADVRFREPYVWNRYALPIAIGIAVLLIQASLIASLLIQRRRRRVAEEAVQMHRSEIAHAARLAVAGQLTASIAHEINQPLGAILSNVDAAELLMQSGEVRREILDPILADIRRDDLRASEVVRRLRTLLAKHEVERSRFDLNAAVTEVARLLAVEAERRRIKIDVRLPPAAAILGDRVQIQQVLINLLLNAMDAASHLGDDRRVITVEVTEIGNRVLIAVSDRGSGIEPAELSRVFDSFYSTKQSGMGLGLSIARTIVETHGGRIWAENRFGGGAVFRCDFPSGKRAVATSNDESSS